MWEVTRAAAENQCHHIDVLSSVVALALLLRRPRFALSPCVALYKSLTVEKQQCKLLHHLHLSLVTKITVRMARRALSPSRFHLFCLQAQQSTLWCGPTDIKQWLQRRMWQDHRLHFAPTPKSSLSDPWSQPWRSSWCPWHWGKNIVLWQIPVSLLWPHRQKKENLPLSLLTQSFHRVEVFSVL